mgnify:FL=1
MKRADGTTDEASPFRSKSTKEILCFNIEGGENGLKVEKRKKTRALMLLKVKMSD